MWGVYYRGDSFYWHRSIAQFKKKTVFFLFKISNFSGAFVKLIFLLSGRWASSVLFWISLEPFGNPFSRNKLNCFFSNIPQSLNTSRPNSTRLSKMFIPTHENSNFFRNKSKRCEKSNLSSSQITAKRFDTLFFILSEGKENSVCHYDIPLNGNGRCCISALGKTTGRTLHRAFKLTIIRSIACFFFCYDGGGVIKTSS